VREIISEFNDPSVGLVGPRRFRAQSDRRPADPIGVNRDKVEALAARMGAPLAGKVPDFFKGTMFWVRPQALAPLRRLGLAQGSFEAETGQVDGALEHAVERLFGYGAEQAGYRIKDTAIDSD
jgi:lipopolysaccharide biosynthesis protein